jgi:hypothetical protein
MQKMPQAKGRIMDTYDKLIEMSEDTGWGKDSMMHILADFIEENNLQTKFDTYLKQKVSEEIEMCGWEDPEEPISFTSGIVPKAAILARVKDPYCITASAGDSKIIQTVVNQGIDAYLEGFTKSTFEWEGGRLVCRISPEEMPTFLRRLWELVENEEDESAESLYNDILTSLNINAI